MLGETGIEGISPKIQRGWLSPSVAGTGRGWGLSQADPTEGTIPTKSPQPKCAKC